MEKEKADQMIGIRIPKSVGQRLEILAQRTGRSKTYYIREAIMEHLDDLEDIYLAEEVLQQGILEQAFFLAHQVWRNFV